MKLIDITNIRYIFTRKKREFNKKRIYKLSINDKIIQKWSIINNTSNFETIKNLKMFKNPQYETGYLLRNKKGFQTITFIQNYDVIVADRNGKVLFSFIDVKPGYFSKFFKDAHYIYFFPVGTINFFNIKEKDVIMIKRLAL